MRKNEALFWIVVALAVFQLMWQHRQMPDHVASHFNWEGDADGWATKGTHLWMMVLVYGLMAFSFGILPLLISRLPVSLINLPHREYWLAPERVKGTVGLIRDRMANLGVITFLFFMIVNYQVGEANKLTPPKLPAAFIWGLMLYMVVVIAWSVRFIMDFRKPGGGIPTEPSGRGR